MNKNDIIIANAIVKETKYNILYDTLQIINVVCLELILKVISYSELLQCGINQELLELINNNFH